MVSADEANARHERRELGYRWNEARGALRFWGWIPGEAGANVALALARGADQAGPDEEGHWEPFPVRGADVLVDSLSRDLADDGDPNRAMLTIDCSTNGEWQIRGHPSRPESVEFRQPDGRIITPYRAPPLDVRVRERFLVTTT